MSTLFIKTIDILQTSKLSNKTYQSKKYKEIATNSSFQEIISVHNNMPQHKI